MIMKVLALKLGSGWVSQYGIVGHLFRGKVLRPKSISYSILISKLTLGTLVTRG